LRLARLREVRELRGWSQSKLAEESDVSRDGISNYETGHREAWPSTARKLADALGVEISDLVARAEELVPLGEAPPETGLAGANPSGKLVDAMMLEDIAELWTMQLARGFYDRRTLARMSIVNYVLARKHDANLSKVRETLPPHFRAQLEAAEERFADVGAQIMETREALEQADRAHPTPPDELAAKREAREAEREELLRQLRGSRPAKHA
jgi:transcriptional regulator with XRE-family HTH domain